MAYNYNKKRFYIIQAAAGVVLFVLGLIMARISDSRTAGFAMMLGGTLCGSGILSILVQNFAYEPDEKKSESRKERVDANDERNIKIKEKSGWATQRVMLIMLCSFVALVTFVLPFNLVVIIIAWALLILNVLLPYIFAFIYSKRL